MTLLSTRTSQMRMLSTSTMAEDGDKHKNNAMRLLSTRTTHMRVLSTRTMAENDDKHKNNDRRRC